MQDWQRYLPLISCVCFASWFVGKKILSYAELALAQNMWRKMYKKPEGYREGCRVYSVSATPSADVPTFTPLSSIDYFQMRFTRSFVYYYEEELSVEALKDSLADMLQDYPQVGGFFAIVDDRVVIDHSTPIVDLIEEHFDETSLDGLTNEQIRAFCASSTWNDPKWSVFLPQLQTEFPVALGKPLTEIKINFLHLDGCVHTVIAVGFSHGLNDANSAFTFINEWALRTKAAKERKTEVKLVVPDHDRSKLNRIPPVEFSKKEALDVGFKIQPYLKFAGSLFLYGIVSRKKPSTIQHLYFSNEVLTEYKNTLISNEPKKFQGKIISRNDILSSLFWKLRNELEDRASIYNNRWLFGSRNLVVIANFRGKIEGIESNYYGNCLLFTTCFIDSQELSELNISDLVLKVRETVETATGPHCKRAVRILNELIARKNTLALLGLDPPVMYPLHTLVTNWSKFDIYGADFGAGRPKRFIYPLSFTIPGIVIVAPTRDNNGLECVISGTEPFFTELQKLGITNSQNVAQFLRSF